MQLFRNMQEAEHDITRTQDFARLSETDRARVEKTYNTVYENNQRLGIKIAQGMAFEAAQQAMNEALDLSEKHIGFAKLKGELEAKGHSADSAGAIAHSIGVKKYGAKAMNKAAHTHKPLGEAEDDQEDVPGPTYETEIKFEPQDDGPGVAYEDDSASIQTKNKTEKFCDACDSVHSVHCPCPGGGVHSQADVRKAVEALLKGMGNSNPTKDLPVAVKMQIPGDQSEVPGGAGAILKKNHLEKGMGETADPLISAGASYLSYRAECAGQGKCIVESVAAEEEDDEDVPGPEEIDNASKVSDRKSDKKVLDELGEGKIAEGIAMSKKHDTAYTAERHLAELKSRGRQAWAKKTPDGAVHVFWVKESAMPKFDAVLEHFVTELEEDNDLDGGSMEEDEHLVESEHPVPHLGQWNTYAGGTAGGGKHSYDHHLNDGDIDKPTSHTQYSISPVTHSNGRFKGYHVGAWSPKAGHAHKSLGMVRDPREGVKLARSHYDENFKK